MRLYSRYGQARRSPVSGPCLPARVTTGSNESASPFSDQFLRATRNLNRAAQLAVHLTAMVMVSDRTSAGSAFGHGASTISDSWPSAPQQLSARCGIIGPIKQHQRFQSLAATRRAQSGIRAADGVRQGIDLRDRAIEAQIFQIVRDGRDGAVRGAAQFQRSASAVRSLLPAGGSFSLRRSSARRAGRSASILPRPRSSIRCRAPAACRTA